MTSVSLILRNLFHFRAVNLALIVGVAVATAVLSGALMVGDSVRRSLVDLAVARLGRIDHVLVSDRFFNADLADRLRADAELNGFDIVPGLLVQGSAARDAERASRVGLRVLSLGGTWAAVPRGQTVLNAEAATALGAAGGEDVLFSLPTDAGIHRDATLARRSREDTLSGLRTQVARVEGAAGMLSLFSLEGSQRTPLNAWLGLAELQDAIGQRGRSNVIVADDPSPAAASADALNAAVRRVFSLADLGLSVDPAPGGAESAITSRNTYIDAAVESAADAAASKLDVRLRKVSVNLLNAVSLVSADGKPGATMHYAVAAGITALDDGPLADDEIAINQWSADRLGAKVGDRLTLRFYRRGTDGALAEVGEGARGYSSPFRIARILPMQGLGADASLTPTYAGLTDAASISDWDPPEGVTIDQRLVTDADEAYWDQHKAAPKLFVSLETAKRLWGESFGNTTSLRIPASRAGDFARALRDTVNPADLGLTFRALRAEQVAAAQGTVDFAQLFVAFSFFLIVAAALLVAMLMRLSVEQRTRQLGAMAALGFGPGAIRRLVLGEGMALSIFGGLLGIALAVGYTSLMVLGLSTWWVGAVGTTAIRLHVVPTTLLIGFISAQIVALLAILWAVRQAGRAAPARLLASSSAATDLGSVRTRPAMLTLLIAIGSAVAGIAAVLAAVAGALGEQAAFLIGGALLLGAGLAVASWRLRTVGSVQALPLASSIALAFRNAARHPTRSVLCVGLIALACFAIVTVAAMRQGEPADIADPRSGSGGHQILVESEIPLLGDPNTELGRSILGFRDPADPLWSRATFVPLPRRAGQDVSCQTLTRATTPSIVGVPRRIIDAAGFRFASAVAKADNPWTLLDAAESSDAPIPFIADASTAQYNLHIGLGQTLEVLDGAGRPRTLQLVATLAGSVFQGSLLMSESSLRSMYPSLSGFGVVLVKAPPADQPQLIQALRDELGEFGTRVQSSASVLASFLEVQNTYLSTFQLLGTLGLMLGTIGLAVVLVRTVIERRSELALLSALGYTPGMRLRLILTESLALLLGGLVLGCGSALIGVLPALRASARGINFASLGLAVAGALTCGVLASTLATLIVSRRISVSALRAE